jgi:hypothetical protein
VLACVVVGCACLAWLGWCGVLVRREDVAARLTHADALRTADALRVTVGALDASLVHARADHAAALLRLDDVERRLQSTIARVGMR